MGLKIIGDDIILMKDNVNMVEVLPLFFGIQSKRSLYSLYLDPIDPCKFDKGDLASILVLCGINKKTKFQAVSASVLRYDLYKHILWALDKKNLLNQLAFIEKLCCFPGYHIITGYDILQDISIIRHILDTLYKNHDR